MKIIAEDDSCTVANMAQRVVRVTSDPRHVNAAATSTLREASSISSITAQIEGVCGVKMVLTEVTSNNVDTQATLKASTVLRTSFGNRWFTIFKVASREATPAIKSIQVVMRCIISYIYWQGTRLLKNHVA